MDRRSFFKFSVFAAVGAALPWRAKAQPDTGVSLDLKTGEVTPGCKPVDARFAALIRENMRNELVAHTGIFEALAVRDGDRMVWLSSEGIRSGAAPARYI